MIHKILTLPTIVDLTTGDLFEISFRESLKYQYRGCGSWASKFPLVNLGKGLGGG